MRYIARLWSSLPDLQLFGKTFCCAATGGWWSWSYSHSKEMFHNGKEFIPGLQVTMAGMVLQVSNTADWSHDEEGKEEAGKEEAGKEEAGKEEAGKV